MNLDKLSVQLFVDDFKDSNKLSWIEFLSSISDNNYKTNCILSCYHLFTIDDWMQLNQIPEFYLAQERDNNLKTFALIFEVFNQLNSNIIDNDVKSNTMRNTLEHLVDTCDRLNDEITNLRCKLFNLEEYTLQNLNSSIVF
jgi:hypothetical protein